MKKFMMAVVAAAMLVSLPGCNRNKPADGELTNEQLQSMVADYANEVAQQAEKIEGLQQALDKATGKSGTKPGNIVEIETGSGRTFNPLNGTITLPTEPSYPGSTDCPASTSVMLESRISVSPTSNWTVTVGATQVTMFHTSGITVKFKVNSINERVTADTLKGETLEPMIEGIPNNGVSYSSIFYSGNVIGLEAAIETSVDEGPAQMRIGLLGVSDRSLTYVTLYEGEASPEKEETVEKLLQTLKFGTTAIEFS